MHLTPDERHLYQRLQRWFAWVWVGHGHDIARPAISLEYALYLVRRADEPNTPMREMELALAWVATSARLDEGEPFHAAWAGERTNDVRVGLWVEADERQRVAMVVSTGTIPGKSRSVRFDARTAFGVARAVLATIGRLRQPADPADENTVVMDPRA